MKTKKKPGPKPGRKKPGPRKIGATMTLSEKLIQECRFCGSPATCYGKYSEDDAEGYACDECCGHGCEDGHCEILPKPRKPGKPEAIDYSSPEMVREWDDAYHRLARELAEKHAATKSAYLEMKDQLPKLKKRVEGLDEEIREAEERWRRFRGMKPPGTQGTLDNLRTQADEYTETTKPSQDAAKAPPTSSGTETAAASWFPEDLWKKVPIERWEKYGLTPEVIEKMKAGAGKGSRTVPPIHTVGDIAGFSQPYPNDPTFTNQFGHIKGIGAETATKIEEAQEKFWKDWNDGFAAAFALENGFTPGADNADDKSTPAGAGKENTGGGDTGDRPKRKAGRPRKNKPEPAAAEPEPESEGGESE